MICYPYREEYQEECLRRIKELERLGIVKLYSYGESIIRSIRVVGKGHSSIIALARHAALGDIALKIRRFDSKRESLIREGELLKRAEVSGCTPKVHIYTRDFIVREFIEGEKLIDFIYRFYDDRNVMKRLIRSLITSSYALDSLMIDLVEISRADKQVIVENSDPERIFYIDLESGRVSSQASNLTRIISYIISRSIRRKRIIDVLDIDRDRINLLKSYAREYKKSSLEEKRFLVDKILELLGLARG